MSYFNTGFAFFFVPLLAAVYNLIPRKTRPVLLLIFSLGFFFVISKFLIAFLFLSILSIYFIALKLNALDEKRDAILKTVEKGEKKEIKEKYKKYKRLFVALGIAINVSCLIAFKYLNFFGMNIYGLLNVFGADLKFKAFKFAAPIGISFYTLQALAYILDVYNGRVKADRNILKVALFLSFFPQIMEGPIVRYTDTAQALYSGEKIKYRDFCFGYQRVLYGFLKKFIIADRLNFLVNNVFDNYQSFSGTAISIGVIGYTVMLYMEFSGTMDVVIGIGEVFGIRIPENFRQPFFAKNISEFWTRWHISLGLWFKDFIFYPVSLSKVGKKITSSMRKKLGNQYGPLVGGSIALIAVWFLNGLWHGAGYTFLFYGLYQFFMILSGNLFEPLIKKICAKLHINRENIAYRVFQSVKMTLLVFVGELFFFAKTVPQGFGMLAKIFTSVKFSSAELLNLGMDKNDYLIVLIALIFVFAVGLLKEKNVNIREEISKKNIVVRWVIYYLLILSVVIFGAYGPGYLPVEPIYADF
ncbi:MAG: MBOAT family protein [Clostridia bacterium]|nr:MBOAT family protein [Clostridia bacterium]